MEDLDYYMGRNRNSDLEFMIMMLTLSKSIFVVLQDHVEINVIFTI